MKADGSRHPGPIQLNALHIKDQEIELRNSIERLWSTDAFNIKGVFKIPLSKEEVRAVGILKATEVWENNRYEYGLMWKDANPVLPKSLDLALRRLHSLERRFKRNPEYAKSYEKVINEYIELGYARLVTEEELANPPPWENFHTKVLNIPTSRVKCG